MAKEMGDVFFK